MRLNATNVSAHAWAVGKEVRPVQLKIGAHRYSMERDEAIELARELVAAVDALSPAERIIPA